MTNEQLIADVVTALRKHFSAVALIAIEPKGCMGATVYGKAEYEQKLQMALGLIEGLAEMAKDIQDKHGFQEAKVL